MKVLIDEGLPQQLRHKLVGHGAATVGYMGWRGTENGDLLDLAEAQGFDVFLTGDQNLPYQQNIGKRKIGVVVLATVDLQLETLEMAMPSILDALTSVHPGTILYVEG